jgi:L-iditol 2-dehydrogenase
VTQRSGRAAVLTEYNAEFEIREFPVPEPEPGALVVEIDVATVCGSDIHVWEGQLEGVLPVHPPLILGHEMVGRVALIGSGAELDSLGEPLRVGDRVVWAHPPCRHCYECTVAKEPTLCPNRRLGLLQDCSVPPHFTGAFAEFSYIWPQSGRVRVPDGIDSGWASAGSCALRTVVNAVEKAGRIDYLDSVVVQGAGPVGLCATAILATHSPRHLIVIGAPDDRLELAREWGATHTVSVSEYPDAAARREAVLSITGTRGPSVLFEVSGAHGAFAEGVELLASNGRYVSVGTIGGRPQEVNVARLTTRALRISGSMGGEIDAYWKALKFLDEHRDRFDWDRLLGNRYPLSRLKEAMVSSRAMKEIKPVVVPALG